MKLSEGLKRRFLSKLTRKNEMECWLWHPSRYGQLSYNNQKFSAHRISYLIYKGNIPRGKEIDHLCRNRGCVNPAHLEVVTAKENLRRGLGPTGVNSRKTHCIHGHPLISTNLWIEIDKNGYKHRRCNACRTIRLRGFRSRRGIKKGTLRWNETMLPVVKNLAGVQEVKKR